MMPQELQGSQGSRGMDNGDVGTVALGALGASAVQWQHGKELDWKSGSFNN